MLGKLTNLNPCKHDVKWASMSRRTRDTVNKVPQNLLFYYAAGFTMRKE